VARADPAAGCAAGGGSAAGWDRRRGRERYERRRSTFRSGRM